MLSLNQSLNSNAIGFQAAGEFCPHHVGHYLGMDTHDTHMVSRGLGLHPGMVVTVEPGIYISEDNKKVPERFALLVPSHDSFCMFCFVFVCCFVYQDMSVELIRRKCFWFRVCEKFNWVSV